LEYTENRSIGSGSQPLAFLPFSGAIGAETLSFQPAGWNEALKLTEVVDTNADSKIVEIAIEARITVLEIVPGTKTEVWTYNGSLPGPLIRGRRGDRLIVHFSNQLPKPTTIHWHGVQVPIEMDGVPGISQPPVEPGGSFTVNGRKRPTLTVRSGAMQRWRIVNTAKSRYFQLQFDDPQPFQLIGIDGGHMEYSLEQHVIVLAPGERVDVLMAPRVKEKQTLTLISVPYDRGFGSVEFRSAEDLLAFESTSLPAVAPGPFPKVTRNIPALSADGARPITIDLITSNAHGVTQFDIKGGPFWRGTSIAAELGEKQLWTISNRAIWAHPIHLHGFFFQEVDEKGIPVSPRQHRVLWPPPSLGQVPAPHYSGRARSASGTSSGTMNSCSGWCTVSTGHGAVLTTFCATLPINRRLMKLRPCVPTTMTSISASFA
jgi:FtsP/CotA-like multicopper oxidase with cupredoxin domain